jgi:GntR family transcriptional regulator
MAGREPQAKDTKVGQVVKVLREKIESGEWPPGREIPSQRELEEQTGFSVQTVRNAVGVLADEGMIYKQRGRRSIVNWSDPPHRLLTGTRPAALEEPRAPFVELDIDAGTGEATSEWTEDHVEVSKWVARWLKLDVGTTMRRRRQKRLVGGVSILMSTSFLPVDLPGGEGWRDVEVGQLALTGHTMTTTFVDDWARMPTGEEFEQLGMHRGVPVLLVCRPYRVLPSPEATSPVRAGVLVVARCDYVYLRRLDVDGHG